MSTGIYEHKKRVKYQTCKCGQEFYARPSDIKKGNGKYCSRKCFFPNYPLRSKFKLITKSRNKLKLITKSCFNCGIEYKRYIYPQILTKFCSRVCKDTFQIGKRVKEYYKKKRTKEYYKKIGKIGLQKQQLSKEPTSIEIKVYEELKSRGLLFEKQYLVNGKFLVDAYIPSLNLVIEADGDYWHSLDRVVKKDKAENAYLIKCGFNLLRFSETEINNGSFKERMVN